MGKSSGSKDDVSDSESVKELKELMGQIVKGLESLSKKFDNFAEVSISRHALTLIIQSKDSVSLRNKAAFLENKIAKLESNKQYRDPFEGVFLLIRQ